MKKQLTTVLLLSAFSVVFMPFANAQTPQERAAKIKEWRANCGDPDPDLRIAYVEAAIATEDQTVIRTCLKETLVSDNPDVQNMALRAALASVNRLAVVWEMPEAYTIAVEKADGDQDKLRTANNNYRYWLERTEDTNGQMFLVSENVSFTSETSKWATLWANAKPDEAYFLDVDITGTTLQASGRFNTGGNNHRPVNFTLELQDDGMLQGTGSLDNESDYLVSIKLF